MKDHNPSSPDAPNEPVAISLDDWNIQPVSLDEWTVASPSSESATAAEPEPQPISLDDWSVQPISLDDWAVPVDTESKSEEKTVIGPSLRSQPDSANPQEQFATEATPDLNEDDAPLNTEEEEVNLPLSEEHLDLEGPIDFSEDLFDDEPQRIGTPTRTIAYDSSKEISREEDAEDELSGTNQALLTVEEDLGLDIDDLELPGTDSGHFELQAEEPVHSANFEDELSDDHLFDPPTTVTIQESNPLSESEELELYNVEESAIEEEYLATEEEETNLTFPEDQEGSFVTLPEEPIDQELSTIQEVKIVTEEVASPAILKENDLFPEDAVLKLQDQDLAKAHEPLIELSQSDLASSHQLSVVKLFGLDLREHNVLPVIKLSSNDLATHHRVVMELSLDFFETHGIERDEHGVILLAAHDLVDPNAPCEDEKESRKTSRAERKKKIKVTSESKWDDQRIIKVCLILIAFFLVAIPSIFHFKFSWVTIPESRFEQIKEKASGYDWYMETMFQYRTKDGGWRWFGRQRLNSNAYERASEEDSMTWFKYSNSGKPNVGDTLD